jgi:hypothetical protein
MAAQIVAGLFQSRGIAEEACGRLRAEGVPERELSVRVLKEVGPAPATMDPELAALEVDPLVFGDVRKTFVHHIRNGETVVLARARNEAEVAAAVNTLRQYAPVAVEVFEDRSADAGRR